MHRGRGWNSRPHSAAHGDRTAAAAAAALLYLWQHACVTQQPRTPALQIAGSDEQATVIISRKPQQYIVDKLPHRHDVASFSAGGRQVCTEVWRYGQLAVARALRCSCAACCMLYLGYVHNEK